MVGLDMLIKHNGWELSGEAFQRFYSNNDGGGNGAYIQGVAPIGDHGPGNGWFAIAGWKVFKRPAEGSADRWLVGTAWRMTPNRILKFEYAGGDAERPDSPKGFLASFAILFLMSMIRNLFYLCVLASLLLPLPTAAGNNQAETAVIAVIVARNQAVRPLSVTEASLIYWRKKLYWADGKRMLPLNLSAEHPLRKAFSQAVLGSLPETQTEYWNGLYYQGTSPPHVVASQEAMLRFVAETPGAIGYVDACKVDSRVKVVLWLDESGMASPPVAGKDCLAQ